MTMTKHVTYVSSETLGSFDRKNNKPTIFSRFFFLKHFYKKSQGQSSKFATIKDF